MDSGSYLSPEFLAEDRSRETINITIIFLILETFIVCIFFAARYRSKPLKGLDFYLIRPAYLVCLTTPIVNICTFIYLYWH